jgi:hypothetical protein
MRTIGFSSASFWRFGPWVCCALLLAPAAAGAQVTRRNLSVTVTDTAGNPVADATVMVLGTQFRGRSDSNGQVEFRNIGWGPQQISVRKLGFRESAERVVIPADGSMAMGVMLSRVAVNLEKVIVRDTGGKPLRLAGTSRLDDFYKRRKTGAGTFFTREDIDKRNPGRLLDMFMGIPGVRLTYRGSTPLLSFARCKNGVEVFVDGQRLNDGLNVLGSIHPNQIEAIEIYHGLASVPPQFVPKPDDCAAILVWTRYN